MADEKAAIPSFTRKFDSQAVEIDGELYEIRQMAGDRSEEFYCEMADRVVVKDSTIVGFRNLSNTFTDLLSRCLFGPDGNLVSVSELKTWPGVLLKSLHDMAMKLNGLDKQSIEQEKNGSKAGGDTGTD